MELRPLFIELDEKLEVGEEFAGITKVLFTDPDGKPIYGLVAVIEYWDTASHPSSTRYGNIKVRDNG